jgi:hypothetical protein
MVPGTMAAIIRIPAILGALMFVPPIRLESGVLSLSLMRERTGEVRLSSVRERQQAFFVRRDVTVAITDFGAR